VSLALCAALPRFTSTARPLRCDQVGKRNLEAAIASVREHFVVNVRWLPFLLRPDEPLAGTPKAPDSASNPRVGQRLKQAGAAVGIDFTGATDRAPNTVMAHALSEYAGRQEGGEGAKNRGLQNRLMEVLFRQYFTDGVYPVRPP
jgi:predicted DsbA family dithiol-disulfide isomerase